MMIVGRTTGLCSRAMCALLFVACALVAAEAFAQAEEGGDQRDSGLGVILVGSSCAVGLGLGAAYLVARRRRRRRRRHLRARLGAGAGGSSAQPQVVSASTSTGEASTSVSVDSVLGSMTRSSLELAPGRTEAGRECPKCSRTFESTLYVCPYDATPLRSQKQAGRERRKRSSGTDRDGLERMACPGCERRYEASVDFCYHDGLPLGGDTWAKAAEAPTFKACDTCGWEGEGDHTVCPNDGGELVEIDPGDSTRVEPTIPLTICPKCRGYGGLGQAYCDDDGALLTPLVDVRLSEFPAAGFGPRRKVCKECGAQYGGAARFCSADGTKLVGLN
jgi:hypothetical protein